MQVQSSGISTPRDWSHIDPAWGNWLAGFIDGEGSFTIPRQSGGRGYTCAFSVEIRRDDRAILIEIHQTLGFGWILDRANVANIVNAKPTSSWNVNNHAGCYSLVCFLDRFPLRAKKAQDFAIWREAVLSLIRRGHRPGKRNIDWSQMAELRAALIEGRKYSSGEATPTKPTYVQAELLEQFRG